MDWILVTGAFLALNWIGYLSHRVRHLETATKALEAKVEWMHKRCEKLEGFSIENFVGGAHPQWQYDELRKWLTDPQRPSAPADTSAEL